MIVDTTTGEVLNPRIIQSNSRIVSHTHQHNHVHSYVRSNRSYFSAARKNSKSIFALFVVMLLFLNYFSVLNGSSREFTFYSVLQYFSNTENYIDLNFFDDISSFYANNANFLRQILSYRVDSDSIFSFINVFLNMVDTIYKVITGIGQVIYFMGECCMTLLSFLLSIVRFIFC